MKVIIYSKDQCPYCDMAVREATDNNVDLTIMKLGLDFEREQLMETFPTARTFPQIIVDGEKIGGYQEFTKLLRAAKANNSDATKDII